MALSNSTVATTAETRRIEATRGRLSAGPPGETKIPIVIVNVRTKSLRGRSLIVVSSLTATEMLRRGVAVTLTLKGSKIVETTGKGEMSSLVSAKIEMMTDVVGIDVLTMTLVIQDSHKSVTGQEENSSSNSKRGRKVHLSALRIGLTMRIITEVEPTCISSKILSTQDSLRSGLMLSKTSAATRTSTRWLLTTVAQVNGSIISSKK